ncbi:BON domain-containing protein [Dyella sp. C9]|uniref:BON domain-containing protein n=1 Tax=Dyella sp. C9 TaxID=2202154 RepID=UPI000DEED5DA|nr:BON domain-containing protein [Dyella sp. C9]
MRTHDLFRKTLIAAGLAAAFSVVPLAQVAAQDAAMQKPSDNQTVPDKTADAWITTKVKSELATTKGIKSTDISVSTMDGVVSLTGTTASATEKNKVEQVAKGVKGVKSVDASGLTVSDTAK